MARFELFQNKILEAEGGYVNDPLDPGGATNRGIIFDTFQRYPIDYDRDGNITINDLRLLTEPDALQIYRKLFWMPLYGDYISDQSFAELFIDHAINAGPTKAVKILQHVLNVYFNKDLIEDGDMGNATYNALESVIRQSPKELFDIYKMFRENYYLYRANVALTVPELASYLSTLISANSTQQRFINGWLNRLSKFSWKGIAAASGSILIAALVIGSFMYYGKIRDKRRI